MTAVAVRARHKFHRDMLRKVHPGWTAAIAFGLFLGHYVVADWAHPHCRTIWRQRLASDHLTAQSAPILIPFLLTWCFHGGCGWDWALGCFIGHAAS